MTERPFTIDVYLADNPTFGYGEPDGKMTRAITLEVYAPDELSACEVAFAICNSYPEEMHADPIYADQVADYRKARNRSLSVGDELEIDGQRYRCDSMGFSPVGT